MAKVSHSFSSFKDKFFANWHHLIVDFSPTTNSFFASSQCKYRQIGILMKIRTNLGVDDSWWQGFNVWQDVLLCPCNILQNPLQIGWVADDRLGEVRRGDWLEFSPMGLSGGWSSTCSPALIFPANPKIKNLTSSKFLQVFWLLTMIYVWSKSRRQLKKNKGFQISGSQAQDPNLILSATKNSN